MFVAEGGLRGASFLKSNWVLVRVYRKGVLKSQCAVVRGCEHCEETKCCRFRNSQLGTLCGLRCTAPTRRVSVGVALAQLVAYRCSDCNLIISPFSRAELAVEPL